jgi:hypothetical protein
MHARKGNINRKSARKFTCSGDFTLLQWRKKGFKGAMRRKVSLLTKYFVLEYPY